MILNPRFYAPIEADRSAERQRLGLDPQWPTGLVLFGGEGSAAMLEIARRLERVVDVFEHRLGPRRREGVVGEGDRVDVGEPVGQLELQIFQVEVARPATAPVTAAEL